jgi:hypothetical protein
MNDSISLTIPRIAGDLRCAAHYLNTLAEGLDSEALMVTPDPVKAETPEPVVPTPPTPEPETTGGEPNPTDVFVTETWSQVGTDLSVLTGDRPAPAPTGTDAPEPPAPPAPEPTAETPAPAGVDVDADGLPWDERIHAGSRKKLAKTDQWKKKRGVSDEEIARVEAELRQVMAIPAEQPAAPQPPAATGQPEAPAAPAPAPTTEQPAAPAPPAPVAPAPTTTDFTGWGWQEFMAEFMQRGMDHSQATEACKAHGIDSTAVLATRPDLIPQVAATLFGS